MYNNAYTLLPMLELTTRCNFVFNGIRFQPC